MASRRTFGSVLDSGATTPPDQRVSQLRGSIQALADSNIIGILFGKRDGLVFDANDEFLRMVGYSREDLDAGRMNWIEMTPPEWSVATRLSLKQIQESGRTPPFEKEFLRKDGTRVPVLIGVVAGSDPETDGLCFVLDQTERKQAEKELDRLMVERFAMLDSVPDGIYGLDLEGRCTFINAAASQLLGYDAEECQGRNMHDLIHFKHADGSQYPREACPVIRAFREGVGVRVEDELVWRKDGTPLPVEYSSYPIVINGRVQGSVVSFKDISARRKTEEALRASEERFRSAFASAAAGMCITDLEGRFLEVNQALCRMTGYSETELLAANAQTVTHPEDLLTSQELIAQLFRKEIPGFVADKRYIRKDGSIASARCSVALLRDASGQPDRFVTIAEDITEQVKAKADLRYTEDRYRCIVENTHEGICMCDGERRITYRNSRLVEMLGYPPGEASFECSGIHFEDDLEDTQRRFDLRKTGVSESFETRLRRADGTTVWVNSSASPIPDEQGGFGGSLCMFTDISARRQLEERLAQAQKMEALGHLAGGIAHDFNNLLTVILGYCGVSERKLPAEDPLLHNIVEIKKAGERAATLTQKLLAFSRKQVLRARVISLNDLIRDMESMLRRLIGENIQLDTVLDPAVANISADPGQMEQVILNLAVNARDAMPNGGQLLIESKRVELDPATAQARALPPGAYALVTFTDNGNGMDAETKTRIFEPFFTTKDQGVGTGLGLSTVLGIVNQSGGAISVYSEVNVGSSFKIYLPLVEEACSEPVSHTLTDTQPAGEVILVVEDDDGIRGLAREVLEERGYRVLEAASGEEAVQVAENSPVIDLLLTDVVMSGMNGHDLANLLTESRPGMRVLYMSGYTETGVVKQGILKPGLNFLAKPFQPHELLRKTSEVLHAKPAAARVLVADDDAQVRSLLATILEAEGYRVLQASNGREAQEACRDSSPDLLITDLVMPEQEGLETIHSVCRRYPHLPVIAISGALGGVYLDLAQKLGADAVLRKPFEPEAIVSEVGRLIAR